MDLLMNGLLMAASLFAGGYCWVLARRVRDLKSLDKGLGAAIVTLTRQIELARTTLEEARASSSDTRQDLAKLISRADGAAGQLRLLLAAGPKPHVDAEAAAPAAVAPAPHAPEGKPASSAQPVALHAVPEAAPRTPGGPADLAEVPKPRVLAPVENPLRRFKGRQDDAPEASEDELLEALTMLAGGR